MRYTFTEQRKLTGTVTINATPGNYESCFRNTGITNVDQILGNCENKADLIATN